MLNMILAMSDDGLIGINNELPWHLPQDLKRFKELTLNQTVIMGKNTYLSLVPYFIDKEILPNRHKIIISSNKISSQPNIKCINNIGELKEYIDSEQEYWLIGGTSLFNQLFSHVNKIFITKVHIPLNTLKEQYLRKHNCLHNQSHKKYHENIFHILELDLSQFKITKQEDYDKFSFINYERVAND